MKRRFTREIHEMLIHLDTICTKCEAMNEKRKRFGDLYVIIKNGVDIDEYVSTTAEWYGLMREYQRGVIRLERYILIRNVLGA